MNEHPSLLALPTRNLKKAVVLKTKIEALQRELQSLLGSESVDFKEASRKNRGQRLGRKARRRMSASARARISRAQKARWAKIQGRKVKAPRGTGRGGHGQLKAGIIGQLKAAEKSGMSVRELAEKLNTKYANISVWFPRTGKRVREIRKIGPGSIGV